MTQLRDVQPNIRLFFPEQVTEERDFYGRENEIQTVVMRLQTGLNGNAASTIVLGERKIGKSSFQRISGQLAANASANRLIPVWLPHPGFVKTAYDYAYYILEALATATGKRLPSIGVPSPANLSSTLSLDQFTGWARQLTGLLPGRVFVLVLDEFDDLLRTFANKDEVPRILSLNMHIVEKANLPMVMFASLTNYTEEERRSFGSTGLTKSELIVLGPLTEEETTNMVVGILDPYVSFDDSGLRRLYQLSGGHPYITKLFISVLLQHHARQEVPLIVSATTFDEEFLKLAAMGIKPRQVFENIYDVHLMPEWRRLLIFLASRGEGLTQQDLAHMGTGYSGVGQELERRGYLMWTNDGKLDFRSEYLRHWLKRWPRYEVERDRLDIASLQGKFDIDIELDQATRRAHVKGRGEVMLTPQEYQVLAVLCNHLDDSVSKEDLLSELYPGAATFTGGSEVIDSLVHRLRGKLGEDARGRSYIETVKKVGYILHRAAFRSRSGRQE